MKQSAFGLLFIYSMQLQSWHLFENAVESKRCIIRPSNITDFKNVYELLTNELVARFQFGAELKPDEVNQLKTFKNKILILMAFSNLFARFGKRWIIENKQTNEFIGCIGLSPTDGMDFNLSGNKKYLSIGIALKSKFWGQGFACEIIDAVLKNECRYNQDCMYLGTTNPANERAQKVAAKLKFEDKGIYTIEKGNRIIKKRHDVRLFVKELKANIN